MWYNCYGKHKLHRLELALLRCYEYFEKLFITKNTDLSLGVILKQKDSPFEEWAQGHGSVGERI